VVDLTVVKRKYANMMAIMNYDDLLKGLPVAELAYPCFHPADDVGFLGGGWTGEALVAGTWMAGRD